MARIFLSGINSKFVTNLDWPVLNRDAASKEYVDANSGGGGAGSLFPFWDSGGNQACIPLENGALPFWDSSGIQSNIPIGC